MVAAGAYDHSTNEMAQFLKKAPTEALSLLKAFNIKILLGRQRKDHMGWVPVGTFNKEKALLQEQ